MTIIQFIDWCSVHHVDFKTDISIRNTDGGDTDELIPLGYEHLDFIYANNEIIIN